MISNVTDNWDQRYVELIEYANINGHTLVPSRCQENPALGNWVIQQRISYKQVNHDFLTKDRLNKLNNIGFVWDYFEYTWNQRYSELLEFRKRHGDCNVSPGLTDNISLDNWVKQQRVEYNK